MDVPWKKLNFDNLPYFHGWVTNYGYGEAVGTDGTGSITEMERDWCTDEDCDGDCDDCDRILYVKTAARARQKLGQYNERLERPSHREAVYFVLRHIFMAAEIDSRWETNNKRGVSLVDKHGHIVSWTREEYNTIMGRALVCKAKPERQVLHRGEQVAFINYFGDTYEEVCRDVMKTASEIVDLMESYSWGDDTGRMTALQAFYQQRDGDVAEADWQALQTVKWRYRSLMRQLPSRPQMSSLEGSGGRW